MLNREGLFAKPSELTGGSRVDGHTAVCGWPGPWTVVD